MEKNKRLHEDLAKRIQQCLSEAGVQADIDLSEHEALVYGRIESADQTFRVIAHISDREVRPIGHEPVAMEIARARLGAAVIRPSLAVQTATGTGYTLPINDKIQYKPPLREENEEK